MNPSRTLSSPRQLWLVAALLLTTLSACTESKLQRVPPPEPEPLDNLLEIRGEFCTEPSAQITFPLKVLYIVDQSASLQCTDGANLRFSALRKSIDQLQSRSNTRFAFVGFSSWSRQQGFTRNRDDVAQFIDPAGGLGPATDYQGALATGLRLLERDMLETDPTELARTRYIVNFISDGNPEPRCLAGCEDDITACSNGEDDDGDGIIDAADNSCDNVDDSAQRPDSLYGVCNFRGEIPDDVYVDITGVCPEYNQENQILRRVQEILALQDVYSVGDIRLNSVLLFSPQDVVEGLCPGASSAFGYDRALARALLQQMSAVGNGTFRDINLTTDGDDFLKFDVSSLKAEITLTDMTAVNEHSVLTPQGQLAPDGDRDGLPDDLEFELNTDRLKADTDGDRYSDLFEVVMRKEGFDPISKDKPAISCGSNRDGDGDGLNDCEEEFLKSNPLLPDTDADGVLDRMELIVGTDPLVPDGLNDLDFDGVFNAEEVRGGTDPLRPDAEVFRAARTIYELKDLGVGDVTREDNGRTEERHCYDFRVQRIPLVETPLVAERGLNRVLLYTSERPSKVAGVPGDVRVACFEAFYNGSTIKNPESGVIDITEANLKRESEALLKRVDEVFSCPFFGQSYNRSRLERMIEQCMPPKVEIDRRLYPQEEIQTLLRRHLDNDAFPRRPSQPFLWFNPIQNFKPEDDCYRPWEYELLMDLLSQAKDACTACSANMNEAP